MKISRSINLKLKTDEKIIVPSGEVWKVTFGHNYNKPITINGAPVTTSSNASFSGVPLGGGAEVIAQADNFLTGIAFTI